MSKQTYFNVVYTHSKEQVYRVTYLVDDHRIVNIEKRQATAPEYDPLPKERWGELTKRLLRTVGNATVIVTSDGFYIPRNVYNSMSDDEVLMMDTLEDFRQFKRFQQM